MMRRKVVCGWLRLAGLAGLGGWVLQAGCIRGIQRELEVLLRTEANPTLIWDSVLVDVLGPKILSLFI